jgi:AraC-like DNA-binding protein
MLLARRLLKDSKLTVAEIAGRIGYESEAAFNRAFRRLVGSPPAAWRQASESSTPDDHAGPLTAPSALSTVPSSANASAKSR